MRKRTFSSKLVLLLGTAAILGFSACTDNDYDFNEIDSTIGIGGDGLEIPSMSTEIIPLKDVLELEENGSVIEDELTGDYVFRQDGADVAPVHPFIDKITVAEQTSTSMMLNLCSLRLLVRAVAAVQPVPEAKVLWLTDGFRHLLMKASSQKRWWICLTLR